MSTPPQPLQRAPFAGDVSDGRLDLVEGAHRIVTTWIVGDRSWLVCACGWTDEWFPGVAAVCRLGEAEAEFASDVSALWRTHRDRMTAMRVRSESERRECEHAVLVGVGGGASLGARLERK